MAKRTRPPRSRNKSKKPHAQHSHLPEIGVLTIVKLDEHGELIGEPLKWDARRKPPHIVVTESGRSRAATVGDKVLAKLRKVKPHLYQALVIKVLPGEQTRPVIGVFVATKDGGIIEPVSRKMKESFMVARNDTGGAEPGELVAGVTLPGIPSLSMTYAKITERLGRLDSPRAASLIAANMHSLPQAFSAGALAEAEEAPPPVMEGARTDLRDIPLVTIDGEDARDFDDAVFAEKDGNGFHLVVAIADVAFYVKEGSELDAAAFERGNSVYFPDRVIPMLPERLSNGLCSLNPDEDRYCLAVHIWIDAEGHVKKYRFVRGLMRSRYRFTYNDLQAAHDMSTLSLRERGGASLGEGPHPPRVARHPLPGGEGIIANLFAAYRALAAERDRRGALDLNLPEYKIVFDGQGGVENIVRKVRLESHRLIEAFMIAANVAAADYLIKHRAPGIYRVHEPPAEEKMEDLRQFLKLSGYNLQKGGVTATHLNRILKASEGKPEMPMIHTSVLRAQMQAYYAHENLGHFGLSLQKYCHFTSPIRRYSDLVVHRSLAQLIRHPQRGSAELGISSGHAETDPRTRKARPRMAGLAEVALHVSETERRAMLAEREANDRYKVSYMAKHIGNVFPGVIAGLNEYGLYVALSDTGINGFIPVRNLPGDFYMFDKSHACFRGRRTGQVYAIGQPIMIRVQEANAMTGSLIFEPEQGLMTPHDQKLRSKRNKHRQQKHRRRE